MQIHGMLFGLHIIDEIEKFKKAGGYFAFIGLTPEELQKLKLECPAQVTTNNGDYYFFKWPIYVSEKYGDDRRQA